MKYLTLLFFGVSMFIQPEPHVSFVEFETAHYHIRIETESPFLMFDSESKAFQFSQDQEPDISHLSMKFSIQNLRADTLQFRTVKSSKGSCTINMPKSLAPSELKHGRINLSTKSMRQTPFISQSSFTCVFEDIPPLILRWKYTPPDFVEKHE